MPGIAKWVSVHRKLVVFIIGVALTLAIHVWGTANPYVSAAILVATGLGIYQAPNAGQEDAPEPGTGPAAPQQVPVPLAPAAGAPGEFPGATRGAAPDGAAGAGGQPPSAPPAR
jgi:hypothetical protein